MNLDKAIESQSASDSSPSASLPEMEPETPLPTTEAQRPPNHWEKIIKEHAANLEHLPVPPKDFVKREKDALKRRKKKIAGACSESRARLRDLSRGIEKQAPTKPKTSLRDLLRRNEKQLRLTKPNNTCHNWVLRPTTENAPQPSPGVPRIVVTTPEGETCWAKDMNPYISKEKVAFITERATKEHDGVMSELHCQTFQQLYQRGLSEKPYGHRPEVLFCTKCWERQMQIEDEEENRLASKGFIGIEEQLLMVKVAS